MRKLKYEKSKADPCLYFKWKSGRLSLWLSWVDDLINLGSKEDVKQAVKNMKQEFECDDVGEMTEYVGCKIDVNKEERTMKITQPVLLQSFTDEFGINPSGKLKTPAEAGKILVKCEPKDALPPDEHKKY